MGKKVAEKPKKRSGPASTSAASKRSKKSSKPVEKAGKTATSASKKPTKTAPVKPAKVVKELTVAKPVKVVKEPTQPITVAQPQIPQVKPERPTPKTLSKTGSEKPPKKVSKKVDLPPLKPVNDPEVQKLQQKWLGLFEKSRGEPAPEYDMTLTYEAKTPIQHKVLGWGYILSNQFNRLEVLFQDGIRNLISNYKKP